MLKQETHPKKKRKGMAENAQNSGFHRKERQLPSRVSPVINVESPRRLFSIGAERQPSVEERLQSNERQNFTSSRSSAFRPVGEKQKGMSKNVLTLFYHFVIL